MISQSPSFFPFFLYFACSLLHVVDENRTLEMRCCTLQAHLVSSNGALFETKRRVTTPRFRQHQVRTDRCYDLDGVPNFCRTPPRTRVLDGGVDTKVRPGNQQSESFRRLRGCQITRTAGVHASMSYNLGLLPKRPCHATSHWRTL